MKLENDFFSLLEMSGDEATFTATIRLNPDHVIFAAHFPGFPVTPGVSQLQIVHELLEIRMGTKLQLSSLSRCKFLKVLDPRQIPQVRVHAACRRTAGGIAVTAQGIDGQDTLFTFQAVFIEVRK